MDIYWEKLGCILRPTLGSNWLKTFAGPAFALPIVDNKFKVFVTGRDSKNRSLIGTVILDIIDQNILEVSVNPILELGLRGTFDENGTSYPWIIIEDGIFYMYYTGWIPGVLVPFMNDMGLAISEGGEFFKRYSRAPLLNRTNDDYLGIGSMSILKEGSFWQMYYTCFDHWGKGRSDHKHYYNIKYACSNDGINWKRFNHVCIDFKDDTEYSIGKPSVLKIGNLYHMWYSYRGLGYKIGHAISSDGRNWIRIDQHSSLHPSKTGWDSEMVCYSHVFQHNGFLYMLYNGNNYGQAGLGIARMKMELFTNQIELCKFL